MNVEEIRNDQFWSLVDALKRIEKLEAEIKLLKAPRRRASRKKAVKDGAS